MNQCRIHTELGILQAAVRDERDYPGIDIRLVRGTQDVLLAWVEIDRVQTTPTLQMRLYADMENDEPTDSHSLIPTEVNGYFRTCFGEMNSDGSCDKAEDMASSWAGYCQYLKDWAESHSDAGFAGCCPACYDEFLDAEWQEYKEQMNGRQDEV